MEYKILQLQHTEEGISYLFLPYSEKKVPQRGLYNVVYTGMVENTGSVTSILEKLFTKFNFNHPADFKGHSLSVSDVVELNGKCYYCDAIGFVELINW
jgi:hypothetical protein